MMRVIGSCIGVKLFFPIYLIPLKLIANEDGCIKFIIVIL